MGLPDGVAKKKPGFDVRGFDCLVVGEVYIYN